MRGLRGFFFFISLYKCRCFSAISCLYIHDFLVTNDICHMRVQVCGELANGRL